METDKCPHPRPSHISAMRSNCYLVQRRGLGSGGGSSVSPCGCQEPSLKNPGAANEEKEIISLREVTYSSFFFF